MTALAAERPLFWRSSRAWSSPAEMCVHPLGAGEFWMAVVTSVSSVDRSVTMDASEEKSTTPRAVESGPMTNCRTMLSWNVSRSAAYGDMLPLLSMTNTRSMSKSHLMSGADGGTEGEYTRG